MKNNNMQQGKKNIPGKSGISLAMHNIIESKEQYRLLFENISQGFALHEIILNPNYS